MLDKIFIEIHKTGAQNSNVFNGGSGGNYGSASSAGYYSGGGTANTRGGSGSEAGGSSVGAAGDSGIVIIRYLGTPVATGGTITQVGGYTIHTFTANGTLQFGFDERV